MSDNQVMAKAVRTFHGEEGPKNPGSEPFSVSRARFADLIANGLVIKAATAGPTPLSEDAAVAMPVASDSEAAAAPEMAEVAEPKSGRGTRPK